MSREKQLQSLHQNVDRPGAELPQQRRRDYPFHQVPFRISAVVPLADTGACADDPAVDAFTDFPSAQRGHQLQFGEGERSCF
jgi:hypothetical protein